jgi:GNAT superfamily N-acetyltransferase
VRFDEAVAGQGVPEGVEALARTSFDLDGDDAARLPGLVWADSGGAPRVRLLAWDGDQIVGVAVGSVVDATGFLDLLAVAPEWRRRGIGRELLGRWEARAAVLGGENLAIGANLHAYAWPGVDIGYTPAIAMFLKAGYARHDVLFNMDVDVTEVVPPTASELIRIEDAGVTLRRGSVDDADALARHTANEWTEVWARETQAALHRSPSSIFLAFAEDEVIGFAAHGVLRATHFGPLATSPAWRRIGLGGALTRLALADMAPLGQRIVEIAWVAQDAIPFYSRSVNARLRRTFWVMTRKGRET